MELKNTMYPGELRDEAELYRATFENAAVGIAHVNLNGTFLNLNRKFCDIAGYEHKELVELTFQDITYPEDLERDLQYLDQLTKGEIDTYSMEKRYIRKDRSIVWINLTVSMVRDSAGDPAYYIAVIEDITSRIFAEKEAGEFSRLLDLIFQHSLSGIVVTDRDFNFIRVNETYARACARDVDYFPGKNHFDLYPSDFEKVWIEARESKKPWRVSARPFVFPDHPEWGVTYWNLSLVPILDRRGEVEIFLFALNDVTDLKRTEEELEKLNSELERRVEERTNELHEAQKELVEKERLAVLGRLTATVSHELRNPLSTIRTSAFLLGELIKKIGNSSIASASLDRLERNITRCDHIIDELLDYTRRKELNLQYVAFEDWLSGLLKELDAPRDARLEIVFEADNPVIRMDADRIRRAFINVYENACQAISDETGRARDPQNAKIVIKTRVKDGLLRCSIRDNGSGIPMEDLSQIFEPLFSTKNFGVGLGLAIVKGIMEDHDGDILVQSEKGAGAEFTIQLPIAAEGELK